MFVFRFFIIELKKIFYSLPKIALGFFVSVICVGIIGFGTLYYINTNSNDFKSSIVVYIPENDKFLNFAVNAFESSEQIRELYKIIKVNEKESVEKSVFDGKATAGIVFEDNFVNSIIHGKENISINVFISNENEILKSIIMKFADCYKNILENVQAGIYSVHKIYENTTGEKVSDEINKNINMEYVDFVFSKYNYFDFEEYGHSMSLIEYYISMLFPLFLILFTMPVGAVLYSFKRCFYKCAKCGFVITAFVQNMVIFIIMFIISLLCMTAAFLFNADINGNMLPVIFELFTISVVVNTVFFLSEGNISGGLILFFIVLICSFFGGAIVPPSFLPEWIKDIYTYSPVYVAGSRFSAIFNSFYTFDNIFYDIFIWIAGYLSVFIFGRRKWRLF